MTSYKYLQTCRFGQGIYALPLGQVPSRIPGLCHIQLEDGNTYEVILNPQLLDGQTNQSQLIHAQQLQIADAQRIIISLEQLSTCSDSDLGKLFFLDVEDGEDSPMLVMAVTSPKDGRVCIKVFCDLRHGKLEFEHPTAGIHSVSEQQLQQLAAMSELHKRLFDVGGAELESLRIFPWACPLVQEVQDGTVIPSQAYIQHVFSFWQNVLFKDIRQRALN